MSLALSNKKSENNISFNNRSLTSVDNQTVIAGGQYSVPEIEVGFKCDYLKLLVNISTSDTELTTSEFKSVTAVYKIEYIEDEEKNINNIRTVCFTPKFQHEVDNNDTYTIIELPAKKITKINMTVYNNESTDISIDMARIYYSRLMDEETVKEMAGTGGGDVPVSNVLKLYNINNEYTIDGYNKSLILDLVVPDDILEQYGIKNTDIPAETGYLDTIIDVTTKSEGVTYSISKGDTKRVLNGIEWTIKNSKITIEPTSNFDYIAVDGLVDVIVRIQNNQQLYGECTVEIKNSAVKDIYIKNISSEDGKIHINNDVTIDIGFLPENSCSAISGNFVLKSYDGTGAANNVYGSNDYHTFNTTLGNNFTLRGVSKGKVSLYLGNDTLHKQFIFDVVCDEDDRLTCIIETNTGLFEITQGSGQLEVYPRPNYDYYGGYSFSQVSIDGGSVTITDKGDYALITGNKNGKLELICTPTYGPSASCEITVSGQYPEEVKLTCADNIFKIPINGTLMVYAEAGNKPNSNYDKYDWSGEKLDADVGYSSSVWDKYCKYTGTALGKFRLSAIRQVDSKFMASQVIKVVQSLDSDKTVLPYPNSQQYWVVYRRTDQGNRLWLLTIDGTVTLNKLIKKNDNRLYTDNITLGAYAQWKIESGQWANHGSWSGDTNPAGSVGQLYASNLDIYNEDGNLLVSKTDNYDDVDFDAIIYG